MSEEANRPLPRFGEWDVNDPATAEGFTVIFNKARNDKKTGGTTPGPDSPGKDAPYGGQQSTVTKPAKKWCCCMQASPTHA